MRRSPCPLCGKTKAGKSARCADCWHAYRTDPERKRMARFVSRSNASVLRRGYSGGQMPTGSTLPVGPCAYCGDPEPVSWDHVQPLAHGGANAVSNLVPCCLLCNQRKGARPVAVVIRPIDVPVSCAWCGVEFRRLSSEMATHYRRGGSWVACSLEHRHLYHRQQERNRARRKAA